MPRHTPRPDIVFIPEVGAVAPVGTRGKGKHQSAVLQKARKAIDEGEHASEDEAAEAFYEEYSGRRVSNESTSDDEARRKETLKRMRKKLRGMAPKSPDVGT